ncbi:MAG: ferrous iron transport protein B [bacterium]
MAFQVIRKLFQGKPALTGQAEALPKVVIVGSPNVGKSLLFNRLTGSYVVVSNYPGTTVEVSRGVVATPTGKFEAIDTPGIYSLAPITAEERVTLALLLRETPRTVVHVIDAKNIQRMLGLTLQLADAGLPVVLALNMADEARLLGIRIDARRLEQLLGIPVVETIATTGAGVRELIARIPQAKPAHDIRVRFDPAVETAIALTTQLLGNESPLANRVRALLLLQDAPADDGLLCGEAELAQAGRIGQIAAGARRMLPHSINYHATLSTQKAAEQHFQEAVQFPSQGALSFRERLSRWLMWPLTGVPILLLVLYFGLYQFVGVFGAGTLVDFLQNTIFSGYIAPWVDRLFNALIPWQVLRDLFIGPYGLITLGVRYAVALIFPIVGTFFLAFSILEDSGYLPRLAMLLDRIFKKIGLNGRAVIPMVLGLGCDTMATIVTRTLETTREKVIASLLLALAVPCSAQMGVILGLLAGHPAALLVWFSVILLVFLVAGVLAARFLPGEKPRFYMELPPLRLPRLDNVLAKTYARMVWYFYEVFPLFLLASGLIWIGQITGLFQLLVRGLVPLVQWMGLPDQAAVAFLFGFFRRDYGAAGLYDLQHAGALDGNQLVVASITLTLFLPCVAQLLIMKKERGLRFALVSAIGITVIALAMGLLVHTVLTWTGVRL